MARYTHADYVNESGIIRAALISFFGSFIHVTSFHNLNSIRSDGLLPRSDKEAPKEVTEILGKDAGNILCLYPYGAKLNPNGTAEPPFVSFSLAAEDLPNRIGLDWSYIPSPTMPSEWFGDKIFHAAIYNANEYGSIVSYDAIPADRLRIFCVGDRPTSPLSWRRFIDAEVADIYRYT